MTSEEYIDRKMRFVWDTLAEITARQDKADARQVRHEEQMRKLEERTEKQRVAINKLILTGMRMIDKDREETRALKEQIKRTDQRFDRWLKSISGSNGQGSNGGPKRNGR